MQKYVFPYVRGLAISKKLADVVTKGRAKKPGPPLFSVGGFLEEGALTPWAVFFIFPIT